MNKRLAFLVAASLVAFASLSITWQCRNQDPKQKDPISSLAVSLLRAERLAETTNFVLRSREAFEGSATCRYFDSVLPATTKVFLMDMTGPTNFNKVGYFFWMTYYLFPREIGVSIDQPTHMSYNEFPGKTAGSNQEILAHGFDVRIDIPSGAEDLRIRPLRDMPLKFPANPAWFNSNQDLILAFLLPPMTAFAGMWLLRFLFLALSRQMSLPEQLAGGLGLGMMAVAALTLGIKLCGFHGRGVVLAVTAVGTVAQIWSERKVLLTKMADGYRKALHYPMTAVFPAAGLLAFLVLFRVAGLSELLDEDATRWMLKAKILHLYSGHEIVSWFSHPRLNYAHLDYPTLVPSLHAATYDSIGHADDFVAKFWPVWMLFFLLVALVSMTRAVNPWRQISLFALLGLLLLPTIQKHVQWEGSTMPMIFFTAMGFIQYAFWLTRKDYDRLCLSLILLLGGAMTHMEGFIFLAFAVGWLCLPSARPCLKREAQWWRILGFGILISLPFVCLRVQIPVLLYESNWAGYAWHHPGTTLANWPLVFVALLSRWFLNSNFASWSGEDGHFHWNGHWDGFSSLYNTPTLGLPWVCLLITVALWSGAPNRRQVVLWILASILCTTAVFSVVFTSFVSLTSLNLVLGYTSEETSGRYLLPLLVAWFATTLVLFLGELPSSVPAPTPEPARGNKRLIPKPVPDPNFPVRNGGYWLAAGALLIVISGIFFVPKNEPSPPKAPVAGLAAASDQAVASPEAADLHERTSLAIELDKAGKYDEALQALREAVRLYPNNPMALNNLAWSLSWNQKPELRNSKEAVPLALRAVELSDEQQAIYIGTLSDAYFQDGQLSNSIETARKARNVALLKGQLELATLNEQFIERYSSNPTVGATNNPHR